MAKVLATILKTNLHSYLFINNIYKHVTPSILPARHLYAQSTLGIDGYVLSRERIQQQFTNLSDRFRTKMNELLADDQNKSMIFTEDLKNMVHIAEANKEDVSLVVKMMKKFNQQNKELRFGSFVFGPVVMRMFYFLNEPDVALECFKAPELQGFFDQLMSYQLLLDLLYENSKYDEVVKTFELIKSKQIQGTKYPKNIVVLTMAASYKLNTPESLKYALDLWLELNNVGHLPMRRAATFCAGLALNQGKPDAALEIISTVKKQNYMTIRNIKIAALADLGRTEDLLYTLRSVLEIDDPQNIKHTFCKEVLDKARAAINKNDDPTLKQDFLRIDKQLQEQGHITDTNLDDQLCSEITAPPQNMHNDGRMQYANNSNGRMQYANNSRYQYDKNKRQSNQYRVYNQRPGLEDMY